MIKKVYVKDRTSNQDIVTGRINNDLYQLQLNEDHFPAGNLAVKALLTTWHARLGHNNEKI